MRNLARLAARIYNTPLVIEEEKGETILSVFQQYTEERIVGSVQIVTDLSDQKPPEELFGVSAKRNDAGYYTTQAGVAIVPVLGSLVQRGSSMDSMSGLTSYQKLASQLNTAMADREVRSIVLEVDSPGGEAAGIFELSKMIREAGKTKPIFSVSNEIAFSGGYILLSSANEAYMTESGMVGSVGVVMYHMDRSKQMEKQGVKVTPIFAGKKKVQFSQHQALDADALAWAQDNVDRTYDRFANNVSAHRGISVESIKATEAALLHSDQARDLKFVDGLATLAEVVAMAGDKTNRKIHNIGTSAAVSNALNVEEQGMDKQDGNNAAPTTETAAGNGNNATNEVAVKAAATSERARIAGILGCDEAKGRSKLAQHFATQTDMSLDAAKAALSASPVETPANALNAAMTAHGTAGNGIGAAGTSTDATGAAAVKTPVVVDANAIFKTRATQAQAVRDSHR